jgi:putative nucleotidyltransferase with HDIG domain
MTCLAALGLPELVRTRLQAWVDEGRLELPLLPDVAAKVLSLTSDERAAATELASILHRDPALAGHVLRVANSAAFGGRVHIVSLQQAVSRLGFRAVSELVLAASVRGRIFRVPGFEDVATAVWRHSAAAGAWAREIARHRRRNVEGSLLCGLLHDIGRPVLLLALSDLEKEVGEPVPREAVLRAVDAAHATVGGRLARAWSLPAVVCESVEHHHHPARAPRERDAVLTTALADRLAHHLHGDDGDEATVRESPLCAELHLYPEDVDALLSKRDLVLAFLESFS